MTASVVIVAAVILITTYTIKRRRRGQSNHRGTPTDGPSDVAAATDGPTMEAERASGTILFVESDDALRGGGARALRQRGYVVLTARNPESALRLFDKHPASIDLVIVDTVLRGGDGRMLAARLRRTDRQIRVVLISEDIWDQVGLEGIDTGTAAFLRKSYTVEQLARTVERLLR